MRTRKRLLTFFAISTLMPFLSIIVDSLPFTLSDIFEVSAESAKSDSTGVNADIYVTSQSGEGYYDSDNRVNYILPQVSPTGKITCTALIKLNKPATSRVTVEYHVEDFTAVAGYDYDYLKVYESTIEAGQDSVKVKLNVKTQSNFSVGKENETFFVSRGFIFVLDAATDANGTSLRIYDGKNDGTGYRLLSDNSLCKDEIICLCGGKYKYEYMSQVDPDYVVNPKSGQQQILMFTDYYDFLTQPYGEGAGDKTKNTYDVGGDSFYPTKAAYSLDSDKMPMDENKASDQHGRRFWGPNEEISGGGSMRIAPYKYHEYYNKDTKSFGIYRDWLNRVVRTGLGHSYGSFNVNNLNQSKALEKGYMLQFMIGDYQFVGAPYSDCPWFSGSYHLEDFEKVPIKKDHYNLNIYLPMHAYEKEYTDGSDSYWAKGQSALVHFQEYFEKGALNKSAPIPYKLDVGGYMFQTNKNGFTNAASYQKWDTVVKYGNNKKTTSEPTDLAPETHEIAWFRVPNNEDEETFGMSIFEQHVNNMFLNFSYRNYIRGDTFFTVLDDAAPEIDGDTTRITCNTMRVNRDGKVRITIPFTEPVQCYENTYFKASVGGGQSLTFRPVKEQLPGCDVVVYEADISTLSNINVSSITISTNILYDSEDDWCIRDFAQSGGHELNTGKNAPKIEKITFKNIEINMKKPSVSPSPQSFSSTATQSSSVSIDIDDMGSGKVYYEFIKKEPGIDHQIINANFTDDEINEVNRYSKSISVSRNGNTNIRTNLTLPALEGRSGEFYCFVKAVSSIGEEAYYPKNVYGVDVTTGIGPVKIDNTAPKITVTRDSSDFTAKERKFNITVDENAGIDSVQVSIQKTSGTHSTDGPFVEDIKLEGGGGVYKGEITLSLQKIMDTYYSLENGVHKFEADYEDFSIAFTATDSAGNYAGSFIWDDKETTEPIVLPFSMHEHLKLDVSISEDSCISDIDGLDLYPLGTEFTFSSPSLGIEKLEASVNKLPTNGAQRIFYANLDDTNSGIHISQGEPAKDNNVVVSLTKPGYYEIVVKDVVNDFYSDSFKFYVTNNLSEPTVNYSKSIDNPQLVVKNIAWQLNDDSKLYYLDSNGSFHSENYAGIIDPIFSDQEEAYNYCLAAEYQDMYLIQLDLTTASVLSDPSGSGYIKADGETTRPAAGQYWVRYKNSTWDINARNVSSWGYYYYCENGTNITIDQATVKKNGALAKAMKHAAQILSENGKEVYLIDDDHIDSKSGAPKLTEGQLTVSAGIKVTQTKTGAVVSGISKALDSNLFANTVDVTYDGETKPYVLASNLPLTISDDTAIYYSRVGGDGKFIKINAKDGTLLKDAVKSEGVAFSGIYKILEVTSDGANLFEVFIDCDAPAVQIERIVYDPYTDSSTTTYNELDGSTRIDFYSKEFQISGEASSAGFVKEVDPYAYVAIFQKNKLITMSYLNSISPTSPVYVTDGIYDVVIGDRSGNRYTFKTYISSSEIIASFKSNADSSKLTISITNREDDELLRFDVYCNGDLVDNSISSQKVFTLAGNYYAVIQDQYGNKITTEPFSFTKAVPEVSLYYLEDGYAYQYNEKEDPPHIIETMGDDAIFISTNSPLMLRYNAQTVGVVVSGTNESNYSINASAGTITFNTPCNFTFTAYYLDNEDNFVTYHVIYDAQEPTIHGTYTGTQYDVSDLQIAHYDIEKDVPESLDYTQVIDPQTGQPIKITNDITYDASFASNYLYFQITDNTGIRDIVVLKDGKEIEYEILDQGYEGTEFYLNAEPGVYVITVYDLFNNTTSLRFTVDDSVFTEATIDGKDALPVGPLTDDGHKTIYGNSGCDITTEAGSSLSIIYEDEVNEASAFSISYIQDAYYISYYGIIDDNGEKIISTRINPEVINGDSFNPIDGVALSIIFNRDGTITVHYEAGAFDSRLEVRANRSDKDYNLYNMEFSKNATTPVFKDCGEIVEPVDNVVYVSREAIVSDPTGNITSIMVAYNPMIDDFEGLTYKEYRDDMVFENGYYQYVVTNIYGNTAVFTVIVSDNLLVSVEVNYNEKDTEVFSLKSGDTFYSNNSVSISSYNVSSINEASGKGNITVDDDKSTITFTEAGTYVVSITDKNHNKAQITIIIGTSKITYNEDWLIGYNEDAILKDEGYTNKALTINLDQESLDSNGITQVFFKVNGEKVVLYGYKDNDQFVSYMKEAFKEAIGSKGDGVYYVYFSNIYGDVVIKEIHYQVATTLEIERTTNMDIDKEAITVEDALLNGVWSNVNVTLGSTLQPGQYHFYVKSGEGAYEEQAINYLFEIPLSSSNGEVHYMVTYIDAYGNIYEFSINLLKRSLAFDLSNINQFEMDGNNYTNKDFFFNYDSDDVFVEYRIDSGEYVLYSPNEIIYADGVYQFHMYDKSGNQVLYTVTKDSIVTITVRVDGESKDIFYGQAVNGTSVAITASDLEKLEALSIRRNGELITNDELVFTRSGHYELILRDRFGNIRYFHFTLISTQVNTFEYVAPDDYVISSAYYIDENGIKVTCFNKVDVEKNRIDLTDAAEGVYEFQIKNKYDNTISTFTVTINKSTPNAKLDGCNDGDVTTKTISLRDLNAGDIVSVYKDDELVQFVEVSGATTITDITESGKYRIVVENKAGATVEYTFEKLNIANGALSALVIIGLLAVAGGFFTVLLLRNRSKNDE